MKDKNHNFYNIEDFIMGNLKGEDLDAFERELAQNKELSEEVTQQKKLYQGIRTAGRKEFVKDLKEIHKSVVGIDRNSSKIINFNWRPILAIASIFLVAFFSWWLLSIPSHSSQDLFSKNYEPYSFNQNLRDSDQDKQLIQAAEFYRNKKYAESLPLFQKAAQNNNSSSIKMAIAMSYFENDEPQKAINVLKEIIDSQDPFLSDLAHWYSALFYLHLDEKENALSHLQLLASSDQNDKYLEAKDVLTKLQ